MCTPHGCRCTRTFLGAPPTPRLGVSEAKLQTPRAQKCAAGTREAVCMENSSVRAARPHPEERACRRSLANSNARARVSKDENVRLSSPSCFETHRSVRRLWMLLRFVPCCDAAALGRDDDGLVRAKYQPADARNDRRLRSIVSGLLFTMTFATRTCRSHERSNSLHGDCDGDNGEASAAFAHPGGGEAADQE